MRRVDGEREFYSRTSPANPAMDNYDQCAFEMFVDINWKPTTDYPHVHIVEESSGRVVVIASIARGQHAWRTELFCPDGHEVDEAIRVAITYLH